MDPHSNPSEALPLLARLYRERRSGLLSIGPEDAPLRVLLRDGHVVGVGPAGAPEPAPRPAMPGPDDSARVRLERVLVEVGIRPQPKAAAPAPPPPARTGDPRGRLVQVLADRSATATFSEGVDASADVAETAGATEPLILEAVRALRDPEAVRAELGDVDQRLVVTSALTEERTLTLTEGYLLSRIDGMSSAREVLQLVPLDPDETERTLLGLLLTGRVEYRAAPARPVPHRAEPPTPLPPGEPEPAAEAVTGEETPPEEAFPLVSLIDEGPPSEAKAVPADPLDAETREWKKEIWEFLNSLLSKNHFEVLGLEPGCSDADVKRAYAALVKRFHPDAQGDPRLEDMHDSLAAILIRAREALEVLGTKQSRAQYEAKSGIVRRPRETAPPPSAPRPAPAEPPGPPAPPAWPAHPGPPIPPPPAPAPAAPGESAAAPPEPDYVPPEQILLRARLLLSQARYWDVIQVLELAVPQMEPRRHQLKGRILLAKAYAKNPKWVRRALEYLDEVVREDATNVEAHYELGVLFKQVGQVARAQAAFRRVIELKPDHREAAAELGLDAGPPGGGLLKRILRRGKAS